MSFNDRTQFDILDDSLDGEKAASQGGAQRGLQNGEELVFADVEQPASPKEEKNAGLDMIGMAAVRTGGDPQGTQVMMLSLTLIILTFFILLNTMIPPQGVATDIKQPDELPLAFVEQDRLRGVAVSNISRELRGIVSTRLRLATPDLEEEANGVRLTVPLSSVWSSQSKTLRPDGEIWLENVAGLLKGPARGWRGMLRVIGTPDDMAEWARLVMVITSKMELPDNSVQIGYALANLNDGKPAVLVLELMAPYNISDGRAMNTLQRGLESGMSGTELHGISGMSAGADEMQKKLNNNEQK